jgi:hypothetical protein
MKDYELASLVASLDDIVEQLVADTVTPNMSETLDRWSSEVTNRSQRVITELEQIQEIVRRITETR